MEAQPLAAGKGQAQAGHAPAPRLLSNDSMPAMKTLTSWAVEGTHRCMTDFVWTQDSQRPVEFYN